MTTSIFGNLIPSGVLETAVLSIAELWSPTYWSEVERQQGLTVPTLARPRSGQSSYDFDNWIEAQLPAIVCVCPGTISVERVDGGTYSAWFEVQTGVLVEDTSEANARRVSQIMQVALEGLIVQRGSLGGVVEQTMWQGRQSRLPDVANRTLAYAESTFHMFVENVMSTPGGPPTPDAPLPDPTTPWPAWQPVTSVVTTVDAEPVSEEFSD